MGRRANPSVISGNSTWMIAMHRCRRRRRRRRNLPMWCFWTRVRVCWFFSPIRLTRIRNQKYHLYALWAKAFTTHKHLFYWQIEKRFRLVVVYITRFKRFAFITPIVLMFAKHSHASSGSHKFINFKRDIRIYVSPLTHQMHFVGATYTLLAHVFFIQSAWSWGFEYTIHGGIKWPSYDWILSRIEWAISQSWRSVCTGTLEKHFKNPNQLPVGLVCLIIPQRRNEHELDKNCLEFNGFWIGKELWSLVIFWNVLWTNGLLECHLLSADITCENVHAYRFFWRWE